MTEARINAAAATGFERGAVDYERARPSYPASAIDLIIRECGIGPGVRVLDLAAGTGKLTRLLAPSGAALVAVEPVAAMREQFVAVAPDVAVLDGTAEAIPLPDSSVDVVTVAQAFHWFDPPVALTEIARVLRPGGSLVLVWNVRNEAVDWVRQFTNLTVERSGGRPYTRYHVKLTAGESMTRDHVADIGSTGLFGPVAEARLDNPQDASVDIVVGRAASTSFVSALPTAARATLLADVRTMLERHPDLVGRDSFVFPHDTWVSWCRTVEPKPS